MFRNLCIAVGSALLLMSLPLPDVDQVKALPVPPQSPLQIPPGFTIPVLPNFASELTPGQGSSAAPVATPAVMKDASPASAPQPQQAASPGPLQEPSRLAIMRNVSGEFARSLTSLPGGKKGFTVKVGEPIDQNALRKAIRATGAALNPGDSVQITRLSFVAQDIVVELNGGGRGNGGSWRDHVQMGIGLPMPISTSSGGTAGTEGGPVVPQKIGATIHLAFGRPLPDMTPDDLKAYLGSILDFSKQRSASVQWVSTLPPRIQQAIADKRPDTGMDRDEILAAMGRPDRKVRERDADGNDTEDWIYGRPPAKTIFVRFVGDKVSKIDQYP